MQLIRILSNCCLSNNCFMHIDKQLINARVDGTEWQHITMVLPKFSSAYTLEIILAGEWHR